MINERRVLPSEHPVIDYWSAEPADAAACLQRRSESGEATLDYDDCFGRLPSVLKALDVPVSSQALVFSETSFEAERSFPGMPRAISHNEGTTWSSSASSD